MNVSTKFVAVSVLTAAIVAGSLSTAQADPEPAGLHYTAQALGGSMVFSTDSGSLDTADDKLEIRDDSGNLMAAFPLGYYRDNQRFPIAARIDGNTATLTPSVDPASATPAPGTTDQLNDIALDPMSPAFGAALSTFSTIVGIGTALGTIIGTLVGATLGCLLGGLLVGGAATIPTFGALTIPGFLGGCIVTAIPGAALGAIVGTIVFGVPAIIIGGIFLGGALAG
ncbi:hypothetical protein F3087_30930 [Nocardia colli]|uniref:DUF8020 domain-containing protein n=1 Tax=Nocardia colli TaxID=2545717 RepID=A0A5N0EAR3_9NOCA|nr:hypothetical protein F3087_30930 [Nocardia colli]